MSPARSIVIRSNNGVTEEETFRKHYQMVAGVEFLKTVNVSHKLLHVVIDGLRMVNVAYVKDDEFTRPSGKLKSYITPFIFENLV